MPEYSGTRLYLGNLPKETRKQEVEDFFNEFGHGNITEVKLMDGFGFIQYESPDDAKDIVPTFHGKEFKGNQLIVQFARGTRHQNNPRDFPPNGPGSYPPRPRRTQFRMNITGLPPDTSWQDLKDFARKSNDSVVYSDMSRERDGRGTVEFETLEDLKRACQFLDQSEYRGYRVTCVPDEGATVGGGNGGGRYAGSAGYGGPRGRSVSPHRGGYSRRYSPPPPRNSPPRYGGRGSRYDSPPHRGYRERSPPPRGGRDPYYGGPGGARERSPQSRRPPPMDDYPPPRPGYGGGRTDDYPPPRRGYEDDAGYHGANGSSRGGRYDDRRGYPPSPPRGARSPPPGGRTAPPPRGGYDEYDRRRY
ncbi:hypothetical protein FN846DRAFT_897010 [Sphaerosporella brunnea]|uniref:RRM domain-containing protein n=1 Tax=Sphaerosporella brunnea TaxID=1250544 RepID=A0A5J5FAJ2_9PEZI|nr:hypothetical protein FN846DRAFT_897010 [Sphaerosporella brunnea]